MLLTLVWLSALHPIHPCRQAHEVHTRKCMVKGIENGMSWRTQRIVISATKLSWTPVIGGVSQGKILSSVSFNITISNLKVREHTLNKLQMISSAAFQPQPFCEYVVSSPFDLSWKIQLTALSKSKIQLMTNQEKRCQVQGVVSYVGAGIKRIWKIRWLPRNKEQCEESSEIANLLKCSRTFLLCILSAVWWEEWHGAISFSWGKKWCIL